MKNLMKMELNDFGREILRLISRPRTREAIFPVLIRKIPGFAGDDELCASENIILWRGLSSVAVQVMTELMSRDLIHYEKCRVEEYILDGGCPDLPIWTKKAGLIPKTPHWMPVRIFPGRDAHDS